jgi:hypothetical protein
MIPDLIFLVILYFVSRYMLRLIRSFFDSVGRGVVEFNGFYPEWAGPTYNLVRLGVIVFSVVMAYPHIPGASTDAFKGVSIFVGALPVAGVHGGHLQHHRRLHDGVPACVSRGRPHQDRRRDRFREQDPAPGDAPAHDEERRGHHPQLDDPQQRGDELLLARGERGDLPLHRAWGSAIRPRGARSRRC